MSEYVEPEIVRVAWLDSRGVHEEWTPIEEIKKTESCFNLSVGFLVYQDEDRIVLCPHIADAEEAEKEGCGSMTIPRGCIQSIAVLTKRVAGGKDEGCRIEKAMPM